MERTLRPWITAGIAIAGAGIVAVSPVTVPPTGLQHRSVQLSAVEHGDLPFPEVSWNDLVANTTANWTGLMDMFHHTTAIWELPSAVYTQGLPQVFNDLSKDLQELAAYLAAQAAQNGMLVPTGTLPALPNFFADPVLNPVSALSLLLQNLLSSGYAQNAAEVAWTGIYQNMLPSFHDIGTQFTNIVTQLGHLFTGGSFSMTAIEADFTTIGTDLTQIGNYLSLAPSTILNGYLNGYPVQSTALDPLHGTVPNIPDAYTLNAPFNANDNVSTTPEFGLLTNPDAAITTDTSGFGDGGAASFDGTVPLQTGTLASLLQSEQTLSDELLTETSTIAGSGVTAPAPTGPLTILGPDTLSFNLDLANIPVIGTIINTINNTVIPLVNGALTDAINGINTAVEKLNTVIAPVVNGVLSIYNGCIGNSVCDAALTLFNGGTSPSTVGDISGIPTIPTSDIPSIPTIPTNVGDTFDLPGVSEPGVPAYTWDITHNDMAILGSFAGLAAPVTGTVSSDGVGNFLADNPVMNLGTVFDSIAASIFSGTPLTFTATLPLDWTNLLAETLQGLFTAV